MRKSDVHNWYSCNICFWGGLTSFTPFFCRFHAGIEKGSLKIEKNWNFSPDGSKFQTFFSIFREPFSIPLWKRRKNGWKLVKSPGKVTFHTLITFRVKEIAIVARSGQSFLSILWRNIHPCREIGGMAGTKEHCYLHLRCHLGIHQIEKLALILTKTIIGLLNHFGRKRQQQQGEIFHFGTF